MKQETGVSVFKHASKFFTVIFTNQTKKVPKRRRET